MSIDTECYEKIGLFFSCRNLPKMDIASQTDPFLMVYMRNKAVGGAAANPYTSSNTNDLVFLGHTSVVRDCANPDWPDQLVVNYQFETIQEIIIRCYDQDDKANPMDIQRHDYIGEVTFFLTDLMCSSTHKYDALLKGPKNMGRIIVRGEAIAATRDVFVASFSGLKLANKDGFFGRSDPFLQISRMYEDNQFGVVWKNDPVMNNLSPSWPQSRIPMMKLCNGDIDRPLLIEIFDWNKDGRHKSMGSIQTSVRGLLQAQGASLNVIEADKKAKSKSYVNSGTFKASGCFIEEHPSLTDYVLGGCEMSLMVAIDFTASNGDPLQYGSLHFINHNPGNTTLNQYQQAILSVGKVLEPYDTDKMFPVYGFGARVRKPDGTFSPAQHCFPIYGGGTEVHGVDGILQAYNDGISNIQLSGPTLFGPLINTCIGICDSYNCTQEKQKYGILMIITDGAINDMSGTIDAIIAASTRPMSIIIIGVGDCDFSSMHELDGDNGLLQHGGLTAKRDIVQFVPFREYAAKGPAQLAQDVLAEVPSQFLAYMQQKKIVPNKPKPADIN